MALTLFRAHTVNEKGESTCRDRKPQTDEGWQTCNCPIRVKGRLNGQRIRKACRTITWSEAKQIVADAEQRGYWIDLDEHEHAAPVHPGQPKLTEVIDAYCAYKQSDKAETRIGPTSVFHLYSLVGHPLTAKIGHRPRTAPTLKAFCDAAGIQYAADITPAHLLRWIDVWSTGRVQTGLRIGRVKEFFRYCVEREYCTNNPADGLKRPKITRKDQTQRLPFSDAEVSRLLDAVHGLPRNGVGVAVGCDEIEALMLVMLHTGAGLSDASALRSSDFDGANWTYRRIKNGVTVDTCIPPFVTSKLKLREDGYYFYAGGRSTRVRTTFWQHVINQVFEMARMGKGSSGTHRFRHTYASRFLRSERKQGGIYELSKLLGHSRVATTEKYYAAYVPEIAERVRAAARSIW